LSSGYAASQTNTQTHRALSVRIYAYARILADYCVVGIATVNIVVYMEPAAAV